MVRAANYHERYSAEQPLPCYRFASFSFVSAMTFLEGYLQTNNSMRIIRVSFMCVLASLLIAALLPTGSGMWLNEYPNDGEGFYPSLSAACFYKEVTRRSFWRPSPKMWSMAFSIVVVALSYVHCILRLFDPNAEHLRRYLRHWPGSRLKKVLHYLESRTTRPGIRAQMLTPPFLFLYALLAATRAFYDIAESMLLEILWLTFAMAWGTIKVWSTRSSATYNFDGISYTFNHDVLEENAWSFGQTLPLILLLLPLLSMAQAYLDNDAKALKVPRRAPLGNEETPGEPDTPSTEPSVKFEPVQTLGNRNDGLATDCRSTSCSITSCNHHPSLTLAPRRSIVDKPEPDITSHLSPSDTTPSTPVPRTALVQLPTHPYDGFRGHSWYHDQIFLLLLQIFLLTAFSLWILTELANVFGISALLRNRVFLIWVLGVIPVASFIHLSAWYAAALAVGRWRGLGEWLHGKGRFRCEGNRWWKRVTVGKVVYWVLRMGVVAGCIVFTFFVSLELAGPNALEFA